MKHFLFLIFIFLSASPAIGQGNWYKEYDKIEANYHIGRYYSGSTQIKNLLKKNQRKGYYSPFVTATKALQIRYEIATGLRKGQNEELKKLISHWKPVKNDSVNYVTLLTLSKTALILHNYTLTDSLLFQGLEDINKKNDPINYWKNEFRIVQINLYVANFQYSKAEDLITLMISDYNTNSEIPENEFKRKKEYKNSIRNELYNRTNLNYTYGEILRKKGNYPKADSIYNQNLEELSSLFSKKEESYLFNQFGLIQSQFFQGLEAKGTSIKKVKNRYASDFQVGIPNIQYNHLFETELQFYLREGNFNRFTTGAQQFSREILKNYPQKSTLQPYIKQLFTLQDLYKSKYPTFQKNCEKIISELDNYFDKNDPGRSWYLNYAALSNERTFNLELAETHLKTNIGILSPSCDPSSPLLGVAYLDLASFYTTHTTNLDVADSLFEQFFNPLLKDELFAFHPLNETYYKKYGELKFYQGDYLGSIKILEELLNNLKLRDGATSIAQASVLTQIAKSQIKYGNYIDAHKNLKLADSYFHSLKATKEMEYIFALQNMGELATINGNFIKAKSKLTEALSLAKKYSYYDELLYLNVQQSMAKLLFSLGQYEICEDLLLEVLDNKVFKFGPESHQLIGTYRLLGRLYLYQGHLIEGQKNIAKAVTISSNNYGENSLYYLDSYVYKGDVYYRLGDYEKSIETYDNSISLYTKRFGSNYLSNADILIQKSRVQLLYGLVKDDIILSNLNKASSIIYTNLNERHPKMAEITELKGLILKKNNELDKALIQLKSADLIYNSTYGNIHPKTADNKVNIGSLYTEKGKLDVALVYYEKAEDIYLNLFDAYHPSYVSTVSRIGKIYYAQGEYELATNTLRTTNDIYLQYIEKFFPYLSNYEKEKYWNSIKSDFEMYCSLALHYYKENPSVLEDVYNYKLATKGLLQVSAMKLKSGVYTEGLAIDKKWYNSLLVKQDSLLWLQSYADVTTDSLNMVIQVYKEDIIQIEKDLGERLVLRNSIEDISNNIKWTDVKGSLSSNEVAVEIIRFNYFNTSFTDSVIYAALIVKAETKGQPEVVILDQGNLLEGKFFSNYRNSLESKIKDPHSYSEYWEYLDAKFQGKDKLYLSTEGVYNQLNPETFMNREGSYLLEKYSIVRTMNTRYLIEKKSSLITPIKYSVLIGNPYFGASSNSGYSQLPGAEKEVNELKSMLSNNNWTASIMIGKEATEKSIKGIYNPKVVHIATHGYFLEDQTNQKPNALIGENNLSNSNHLLRSGLLFAGADSLMKSKNPRQFNRNDGVLTAQEAMNLNLQETELVFLSACETGRGDFTTGREVQSLQSAFMVAGAQNVIMTLFKVDDAITQELVNAFYAIWIKTGNKREALIGAKKIVATKHEDPINWGAFVLVGMD